MESLTGLSVHSLPLALLRILAIVVLTIAARLMPDDVEWFDFLPWVSNPQLQLEASSLRA